MTKIKKYVVTLYRGNGRAVKSADCASNYSARITKRQWDRDYDETYYTLIQPAVGDAEYTESLEQALAIMADELLTYQEYYGTTLAQVKHLQNCGDCSPVLRSYCCPNYPRA